MLCSPFPSPSSPHQDGKFALCTLSISHGTFVRSILKVTPRAWLNVTWSLGTVTKIPIHLELEHFTLFKSGKPYDNKQYFILCFKVHLFTCALQSKLNISRTSQTIKFQEKIILVGLWMSSKSKRLNVSGAWCGRVHLWLLGLNQEQLKFSNFKWYLQLQSKIEKLAIVETILDSRQYC